MSFPSAGIARLRRYGRRELFRNFPDRRWYGPVSINDGNFHICCNTVFVNNIIGIWVKDYNSESNNTAIPHQGYVSSTYFEYNSSIPMFYDYSQYPESK